MRALVSALFILACTSTTYAQTADCTASTHDLVTAQEGVTKANINSVTLFLAVGVAIRQDEAKRKAALDVYCAPAQMQVFDASLAALDTATAAAKNAEQICPAGQDADHAKALHSQYDQLKDGTTKMQKAVTQICEAGR